MSEPTGLPAPTSSITAADLAEVLVGFTVEQVEAAEQHHLPDWDLPRTFAGHGVAADVRADLCFTLTHLADAGIATLAGRPVDDVLRTLLARVDGSSTHTFFSYRIAETLARTGTFTDNPLTEGFSDDQLAELGRAVDSSDWLELLDAGVLPRNYAAVLARCELGRHRLGLAEDDGTLDRLVARVVDLLGENRRRALDDSHDHVGRYDIYTADVWLFCEPLAERIGPLWQDGFDAALDLVRAVGARDGTAVAWGRSTGDLGAALTLELAAHALASGRAGDAEGRGHWLRRAVDAARTVLAGFDPDGVSTAHRHRSQDGYRGPARRLQLTFDLLGKVAWAAVVLRAAPPDLTPADSAGAYPPQDRWIGFEDDRPAGVWAHRSPGADLILPFVGTTRSHYLPAPRQPGTWEVPVDRDLPCWTPLVLDGLGRYTAGGVPAAVDHRPGGVTAAWDELAQSGKGLDGDDPGPPLAGSRTATFRVERRSLVLEDRLTFDRPPAAVSLAVPEVPDRPLDVEWTCATPHRATTVVVDGLAEWRTPWCELARVHQIDLDPATELAYTARVTPRLRVASTAHGHHYHQSLYGPLAGRVVDRRSPVGWDVDPDPGFAHLDLLHLHWPEWLAFDDLAAHRAIIDDLVDHGVPVVWTAHNLTPHEKRAEVYDPIYAAWAEAVDGVIHHSGWGERLMRERYPFRPDCRHEVIAHGHFGDLWRRAGLPDRADAERRLGLTSGKLRIGVVGAPRAEKLVQAVLDGVAASRRDDVELVCWSLGPDDVVPDDPRIAVAERYRMVDRPTYATRLATCDVLALVFDPAGEMLATGAAADAVGLGLPALRSDWGYLVEALGGSGIPAGHTAGAVAATVDELTPEVLAGARAAAATRRAELDWGHLADRTFDLFERVVLGEP